MPADFQKLSRRQLLTGAAACALTAALPAAPKSPDPRYIFGFDPASAGGDRAVVTIARLDRGILTLLDIKGVRCAPAI
jgi:hypothetical protein